ncbi:MAG: flagellar biosynthesis protein FlgJ [Chelatococcus sp.]|nr:MAG: flagellar biosynthesis protein FlgJ [Chelatococcus sp.]
MNPALAIPAAKLALGVAGSVVNGVANALDPAKAKAKKQADDFETMFLEQMTERLTKTEGTEGPLGENGTGGDIWRSQLSQEYAKQIQKAGGVGLSDQIMRDLISLQEQAAARTAAKGAAIAGATNVAG